MNPFDIAMAVVILLIGGAISYFVGYRLGQKSGSFKKREIDIFIGGRSLIRKPLDYVVFAYPPTVRPDDKVVCYLPIQIINTGDLSLMQVTVNWKMPSVFRDVGIAEPYMKSDIEVGEKPISRKVNRDEPFDYISYVIPRIDPNVCVGMQEYVNIALCNLHFNSVDVTSKDGVPLKITPALHIRVPVEITVLATDLTPITTAFRVRAFQAENTEQLVAQISKPDLDDMKEDLKRRYPRLPDSTIQKAAEELTNMGGLPRMEALIVMPKLDEKMDYGEYRVLVQDTAQSTTYMTGPWPAK